MSSLRQESILETIVRFVRGGFSCYSDNNVQILEEDIQRTVSSNGSSVIGIHSLLLHYQQEVSPLDFYNLEISTPVSTKVEELLHHLQTWSGKGSVDNYGKHMIKTLESEIHLDARKLNDVIQSRPSIVFVVQTPQKGGVTHSQQLQKVPVTMKSSVLKVGLNIQGGFSMDIANQINEELQVHYNNGVLLAYLADDKVCLTLIIAKDLCDEGQSSGVVQQNMINAVKRNKY